MFVILYAVQHTVNVRMELIVIVMDMLYVLIIVLRIYLLVHAMDMYVQDTLDVLHIIMVNQFVIGNM